MEEKNLCLACEKMLWRFPEHFNGTRYDDLHPTKCKICWKVFSCKYHLDAHTRVHTGEKPFVCSTCGKGFTRKFVLKSHQATHNEERNHKCTICTEGRFFKTKGQLSNHMKFHFEPEHECKQCGKKFHQSSNLNTHMKTHFDPVYSCLQCGKKFNN